MEVFPSDVTDRRCKVMRQLLPPRSRLDRRPIDRRGIINAILYVVRTGCQWRMLPIDLPKWSTVYGNFWRWRNEGVWQRLNDKLRETVRKAAGKKSTPTVAIVDSQSIRTAEGGEERGYDAGNDHTPDEDMGDGSRVFWIGGDLDTSNFVVDIHNRTLTGADVDDGAIHATAALPPVQQKSNSRPSTSFWRTTTMSGRRLPTIQRYDNGGLAAPSIRC